MNDEELRQQQEQAILQQGIMMSAFKQTQEYQLLRNTFEVMALTWKQERLKSMKTQSSREMCLYFTGKEDAVIDLLLAIDKIIIDGESLRSTKERLAQYEEK